MYKLRITTVIDDGHGDVIGKSEHECLTIEVAAALTAEISKCVKEVLEVHITK